ncbi:hypothetical protein CDAR_107791 [Caerostris darwini]|uniref:Uncharacterized protein n=1 Tax=Caerostris darwini TaxID=1538125 RepID=A0AAV4T5G4_9ARAC|nr:hypothetical protein CDAR_107791 [Caerostris darwini]
MPKVVKDKFGGLYPYERNGQFMKRYKWVNPKLNQYKWVNPKLNEKDVKQEEGNEKFPEKKEENCNKEKSE